MMANPEIHPVGHDGAARIALIGLGGAAERILLPALTHLDGVAVVAGADIDLETRRRAESSWRLPRTYDEPDRMLTEVRPDIAIVATPPLTHGDLCLLAINHGCHVFCEKPFVASLAEADRVLAAADQARRLVSVNNQYYQMPIFRAVRTTLDAGTAGRLYHIDVWQHMHLRPDDEGGWKAALQPRRVLYEFGTHALDLICQFFGAYPTAVAARIPRIAQDVDADVLVVMRLDFPGDRTASIVLNRMSFAPKKYLEMRLHCERGSIRASLGGVARIELGWNSEARRPRIRASLSSGGEAVLEQGSRRGVLARQSRAEFSRAAAGHFTQFVAATRNGGSPMVSGAHAREVLKIVFAGYRSAEAGGALTPC